MPAECSLPAMQFARLDGRAVVADFGGSVMTSDAGALLLGATDLHCVMLMHSARAVHRTMVRVMLWTPGAGRHSLGACNGGQRLRRLKGGGKECDSEVSLQRPIEYFLWRQWKHDEASCGNSGNFDSGCIGRFMCAGP